MVGASSHLDNITNYSNVLTATGTKEHQGPKNILMRCHFSLLHLLMIEKNNHGKEGKTEAKRVKMTQRSNLQVQLLHIVAQR